MQMAAPSAEKLPPTTVYPQEQLRPHMEQPHSFGLLSEEVRGNSRAWPEKKEKPYFLHQSVGRNHDKAQPELKKSQR